MVCGLTKEAKTAKISGNMAKPKRKVYLDYGATTPVSREVFLAMEPYFSEKFGNASSIHFMGEEAAQTVQKAREQVAEYLGAAPEEIIFTSGATESNNLTIKGVAKKFHAQNPGKKPHIITTKIEHHCVIDSIKSLEEAGQIEATYLGVSNEGIVELEELKSAIKENTILISVMYVNNEIGTVQPIKEIGRLIKELNDKREQKILFHTDAVQAVNYFDCEVGNLGVDFLSFSGHKIYGPKGVGVLYVKKGSSLARIQDGGSHEFGLRAGTLNVPGIVGVGEAIEQIRKEKEKNAEFVKKLRDKLIAGILENIPGAYLNGSREMRSPNNANLRFDNVEGEALLYALSFEGIAVSTASACASKSLKPSHVLSALGLPPEQAHGSVRITLGKYLEEEDINYVLEIFPRVIEKLRQVSGSVLQERLKEKEERLPEDFGC